MTLIIKELIIRGVVTSDKDNGNETNFNPKQLSEYLDQMRKEIEQECFDKILHKLETHRKR